MIVFRLLSLPPFLSRGEKNPNILKADASLNDNLFTSTSLLFTNHCCYYVVILDQDYLNCSSFAVDR
jgi:hypothetical protein